MHQIYLVQRPKAQVQKNFYLLTKKKMITGTLSLGTSKFMGYCQLTPKHPPRRIDVRSVNWNSFHTALLYFTGSKKFNIDMRKRALDKNIMLNEYGVYKIDNKKDRNVVKEFQVDSEEDVFKIIGMDYVKPEDRNIV